MKRKYLILHSSGSGNRSLGFGGPTSSGKNWQIDTDELDFNQASALEERTDVKIAPAFPLDLIKPVSAPFPATSTPWGLNAVGATQSAYDGSGVVVAILDTGIDVNHEAFKEVKITQKNFTSGPDHDTNGHGTHCAATVFGGEVGGERVGIAPKIRKALIGKVLAPSASTVELVKSIEWAAENGASIINMSLGFDFPKMVLKLKKLNVPEEAAISMALVDYRSTISFFEKFHEYLESKFKSQMPLVIAATGNESNRNAAPPYTIAACPPATSRGFMSVGALASDGVKYSVADSSNTGAQVSAPGVGIVSAALGGGLVSLNGTSMATAHVTGVAALWLQKLIAEGQQDTDLLASKVKAMAINNRMSLGFTFSDFGAGLVQAP